nr:putative reverse transcriptase domain-containing protein [Tanacetum cinerariifolium]
FIEGFSKIAKSMTKLTQKKVKFDWDDKEEAAFQLIKQKLCSAPILALPEGSKDFIIYCDASIKRFGRGANAKGKAAPFEAFYGWKCRGCGLCEEVRILLPEMIFTFPCELRTSLGVPSNFDDWDMALL